jgi:hypothetical protein
MRGSAPRLADQPGGGASDVIGLHVHHDSVLFPNWTLWDALSAAQLAAL